MKKLLVVLCSIFLFVGCSCSINDKKPEDAIDSFFEMYRNKDESVISQLKETINLENITDSNKEKYQELMEKQYDQMAYVVKNITETSDEVATATVEITVLDYKSAILLAESELSSNPDKFKDEDGNFSNDKYMDYKISEMQKVKDTTTYTIELKLQKTADMWKVTEISNDDISKIHGIY